MKKTVSLILVFAMLLSMSLAASSLSFAADTPKEPYVYMWDSESVYFSYTDNQEYTIVKEGEEPDWTNAVAPEVSEDGDGAQYTGLDGATKYEIYTRIKASGNNAASEAVSVSVLTSLMSAGIDFSSDLGYVVGSTITAEPEPAAEGLSYQWYYYSATEHEEGYYTSNYEEIEGATDASYKIEEKDYQKTLAVKIFKGEDELMAMDDLGPVMTEEEAEALIAEYEVTYLESEINVELLGENVLWTDVVPFIDSNNRTMVPLRAVAEAMMLDVEWDAEKREAKFTRYDVDSEDSLYFPIDSKEARFELTKDGELAESGTVQMDTEAVIVDSRTYAPIRYLAEYFGYTVDWDAATKTVLITELATEQE